MGKWQGRMVWEYRNIPLPGGHRDVGWTEKHTGRKLGSISVEKLLEIGREQGCRLVAGKRADTTFVFECPDE